METQSTNIKNAISDRSEALSSNIIYPIIAKKYSGKINALPGGKFSVSFSALSNKEIFSSYEAAFEHLRNVNIKRGLYIKNIIMVFDDHLEVTVGVGTTFICDKDNIDLVQKHNWYLQTKESKVVTARASLRQRIRFDEATIKAPFGAIAKHLDGNQLNNLRSNLVIKILDDGLCVRSLIPESIEMNMRKLDDFINQMNAGASDAYLQKIIDEWS